MQLVELRQINHIRKYLTADATKSLVNSRVRSILDYCNSLLIGVPKTFLNKLQNVQNTDVRLVTRTSRYTHITPILSQLHWLPIQHRTKYKILTHTFKALHDESPTHIKQLLKICKPNRALRSKELVISLVVPKSRTVTYGDHNFMTIAPKLWNDLPVSVRECKRVLLKGL